MLRFDSWFLEGQNICLKVEKYRSTNRQRKSEKKKKKHKVEERECNLIINIDSDDLSGPERWER